MTDTKVGQQRKDDPVEAAKAGIDAMMRGEGDVVTGWKNKVLTAMASVTPDGLLSEIHRKTSQPGSGEKVA